MTTAATDVARPHPSHRFRHGKDELNLAEFPISVLSRRQPLASEGKRPTIVYEARDYDPTTKRRINQKVTITASPEYGLPTPADEQVTLALLYTAKHSNDFATPKVHFVPAQLISLMRWPLNPKSYQRLERGLDRLTSVTVKYENAYWDPAGRGYLRKFVTGILADYNLVLGVRGRKKKGELPSSWSTWRPAFHETLRSGSLKTLDVHKFFSLRDPILQRLYRLFDKRFYTNPHLEMDLIDFACGHIGITGTTNIAEIKRRLAPHLITLEEDDYIERADPAERYHKIKPGAWRICVDQKPDEENVTTSTSETPEQESPRPLNNQLTARGVTAAMATELTANYSTDHITVKLEVFDWLMEKRDRRVSKNPAGYLVKSLQDDYQPPKGFKTKAERQAKQEQQRRREETQRQREAEEEARHQQERERIDAYLNSLTPKQQAKLEQEAIAQAPLFFRRELKQSRTGPMAETIRQSVIDQHVRRLLDEKDQADSTPAGQGSVARPQS